MDTESRVSSIGNWESIDRSMSGTTAGTYLPAVPGDRNGEVYTEWVAV